MSHPYKTIPAYQRWSKAVAAPKANEVDPVVAFPYRITPDDRIVTAGSCFAQHIARYLANSGYGYYVAEQGHPGLHPAIREKHGYGLFSARYGNIYTSRQFRQLFERVLGTFEPEEDVWTNAQGRFVDPFRPTVQPGGFHSVEELRADRALHFEALRDRAFPKAEIFVFTLGLTETWVSRRDGAAFPLCPGVEGGEFDPERHAFVNLTVDEVVADMEAAIGYLRGFNPRARVILTVSPVPLAATAVDRHVLVSTTLSKSVLRVAADILSRTIPDVAYFPSYEIITGTYSRGAYFASDLRSVTDAGVDHVMRLFFEHATVGRAEVPAAAPAAMPAAAMPAAAPSRNHGRAKTGLIDKARRLFRRAAPATAAPAAAAATTAAATPPSFVDRMEEVTEAICEEAMLDR
ncbi:GSCFA domain-containing protein [Amaricoccus solimangrovi]|uniref:GSCFA domain-containing protein n=1 Tax=Amaricoccus solimangrovi TaxID=2589815 RepID=A0A501WTQ3_9RHOB|nr:GSCFA domain-containing protein [Amaricoccus solimangrovi]TPE52749.1 GSCFA domain-containing protein [Amaricoccus solimangrovi]